MALLATSVLTTGIQTAHHPSLWGKEGRHNNVSWRLSPSRGYNLSLRSRAVRPHAEPQAQVQEDKSVEEDNAVTRKSLDFPDKFVFGAGTSSYQVEGAWNVDGKGPSTWDHYCHTFPGYTEFRHNGDNATNSYFMYKEDVKMLKAMGMNAYRFSISWPRILPNGTRGQVNEKGIAYYNNLINELKDNGIEPYVTLFHWETPQALDEEYGGFLSTSIIKDFKDYANVCFEHFGNRVKYWFTFNEPYIFCSNAWGTGRHAPGRCSPEHGCAVPFGDSLVEPYQAGHNLLLAHAETVELYKTNYYKADQDGKIGIALVSMGYEPHTNDHLHLDARNRSIDHNLGWFLEPLFKGDYPFSMRALIQDRLPRFTKDQKKKLQEYRGDMLGLNYYTSRFSKHMDEWLDFSPIISNNDHHASISIKGPDGKPIGENTGAPWLYSYPKGLNDILTIIRERCGNIPVYITENGVGDTDNGTLSMEDALNDNVRIKYIKEHIEAVRQSIKDGSNVEGYFAWSLMDNFQWVTGYTQRYGLVYIDYKNDFKRHMKKSAKWFANFNGVKENSNQQDAVTVGDIEAPELLQLGAATAVSDVAAPNDDETGAAKAA